MGSATRAMLFAAVLALAPGGTARAGQDEAVSRTWPVSEAPEANADDRPADEPESDDTPGSSRQLFSPLGALALGLLGLVWIRRRSTVL